MGAVAMVMVACSGGSGSTSTGGVFFTHSQLANEFVRRLNIDEGFDVELVKTNTRQFDYIVVYDRDFDTYDAYYLGNYNVGENLSRYLDNYDNRFFFDLDPVTVNGVSGFFEDPFSGLIFEKTAGSTKDLLKAKAFAEGVKIKRSAEQLVLEFGLSESASLKMAKATMKLQKKTLAGTASKADINAFTKEVVGGTVEEINAAVNDYTNGNTAKADALFAKGAELNETTPDHMSEIVMGLVGN